MAAAPCQAFIHHGGTVRAVGVEIHPSSRSLEKRCIDPCTTGIIRIPHGARKPLAADASCIRKEVGRCVSCGVSQLAVLGEVLPSGLLAPDSLLKHLRPVPTIAPHGLLVGRVVESALVATADGPGQTLVLAAPSKYLG